MVIAQGKLRLPLPWLKKHLTEKSPSWQVGKNSTIEKPLDKCGTKLSLSQETIHKYFIVVITRDEQMNHVRDIQKACSDIGCWCNPCVGCWQNNWSCVGASCQSYATMNWKVIFRISRLIWHSQRSMDTLPVLRSLNGLSFRAYMRI